MACGLAKVQREGRGGGGRALVGDDELTAVDGAVARVLRQRGLDAEGERSLGAVHVHVNVAVAVGGGEGVLTRIVEKSLGLALLLRDGRQKELPAHALDGPRGADDAEAADAVGAEGQHNLSRRVLVEPCGVDAALGGDNHLGHHRTFEHLRGLRSGGVVGPVRLLDEQEGNVGDEQVISDGVVEGDGDVDDLTDAGLVGRRRVRRGRCRRLLSALLALLGDELRG